MIFHWMKFHSPFSMISINSSLTLSEATDFSHAKTTQKTRTPSTKHTTRTRSSPLITHTTPHTSSHKKQIHLPIIITTTNPPYQNSLSPFISKRNLKIQLPLLRVEAIHCMPIAFKDVPDIVFVVSFLLAVVSAKTFPS
jgi:hypothetical protein